MYIAYLVITALAAGAVGFAAYAVFTRASWVTQNLTDYGVSKSWWPWLGIAKAAGAAGLIIGLFVPVVGFMAGIALVIFFIGAVVTVVRAHLYSHIPYPLFFLAPVVLSLVLLFANRALFSDPFGGW